MIFADCTKEDLRKHLQQNSEAQTDIVRKLHQMDISEAEILKSLHTDSKAVELLYSGWTGEAAKKYILQAQEETEIFRKRYLNAFSQERDQLHEEQKRLQLEEQAITDAIAKQSTKEKERNIWDESY